MNLKLNVYNGKEIEKTYTCEDFNLETGVCEDILKEVDIDSILTDNVSDTELSVMLMKIVIKNYDKFKHFIKMIFEGITDDEIRRTKIKDVGGLVVKIIMFTIQELFEVGASKN